MWEHYQKRANSKFNFIGVRQNNDKTPGPFIGETSTRFL
jgi:hypothetical protein